MKNLIITIKNRNNARLKNNFRYRIFHYLISIKRNNFNVHLNY